MARGYHQVSTKCNYLLHQANGEELKMAGLKAKNTVASSYKLQNV
jgi:hypothetical protein